MKLFYGIKAPWPRMRAAGSEATASSALADDPLSHPAIARMSPRELADLPFGHGVSKRRR